MSEPNKHPEPEELEQSTDTEEPSAADNEQALAEESESPDVVDLDSGEDEANEQEALEDEPGVDIELERVEMDDAEEGESTVAEESEPAAKSGDTEVVDAPRQPTKKPKEPQAPPIENPAQAKSVIECLLFTTVEPISINRLTKMLSPLEAKEVRGLIVSLQNEYDQRAGGLQIVEVAGGFQMATRTTFSPWVLQLHKNRKRPTLSPASLETLAIVAYKQPITRAEVDSIRGVDSSSIVRMLQDLELIKVTGHKEILGRPQLYGTTKGFLKVFGLNSLNDLPSITELKQKFGVQE